METINSGSFSPFTGVQRVGKRSFWIVDQKPYDFTDFMNKHPGGAIWFRWSVHRDISILMHAYHANPYTPRYEKILSTHEIKDGEVTADDVDPKLGLPQFLLNPSFEAKRDIPVFEWDEKRLLPTLKKRINEKSFAARVRKMDQLFDFVTLCILAFHIFTFVSMCMGWMPAWVCCLLLPITRTSLGGAGHYYVHRAKPFLLEGLFDFQYVGACLITMDGHVLLHHAYTQTGGDVKRTFFSGMLSLPWMWRIPGYTLHKLGVYISGMVLRGVEVQFMEVDKGDFRREFWAARLYLFLEFVLVVMTGSFLSFFVQFCIALWINTFLVVSSHDFEEEEMATIDDLPKEQRKDWGMFEIANSYDLTVIGISWIDCFLSAGLSPHRAHHLLPYQNSGFANIISTPICREVAEEFGIEWKPPKNFFKERLPVLAGHYLYSHQIDPRTHQRVDSTMNPIKQLTNPGMMMQTVRYIISGFVGIGAI